MFGLGGTELFFIVLLCVLGLLPMVITLWALVDVLKNEFTGSNKMIWALVVLVIPPLGAILYYFIGTRQKLAPTAGIQ